MDTDYPGQPGLARSRAKRLAKCVLLPIGRTLLLPVDCLFCVVDVIVINARKKSKTGHHCPCVDGVGCLPSGKYSNKWLFRLVVCPDQEHHGDFGIIPMREDLRHHWLRGALFLLITGFALSGGGFFVMYRWPELHPAGRSPEEVSCRVEGYIVDGDNAAEAGDLGKALDHYRAALVLVPGNTTAAFRAAECLEKQADPLAWAYYRRAALGAEGMPEAARRIARHEYENGRIWTAGTSAERALELGIEDADCEAMAAEKDMNTNDLSAAREHLERAMEMDSASAIIRAARARLLLLHGKVRQAATVLDKPPDPPPDSYAWRLAVASVFLKQKKYPEALAEGRLLIDDYPDLPALRIAYIGMLLEANRREEAIGKAGELEGEPSVTPALRLHLASILEGHGVRDHALSLALELVEGNAGPGALGGAGEQPNETEIWQKAGLLAGRIYLDLCMFEPALRQADRVLQADPDNREGMILAGKVALARGDGIRARGHFQWAVEINPGDAEAHYLLGRSHLISGRRQQAVQAIGRACELAPGSGHYHYEHGHVLLAIGKVDEAKQAFERALELLPRAYEARTRLGMIAHEAGDLEAAADYYRGAISEEPGKAALASNNLAELLLEAGDRSLRPATLAHTAYANSPPHLKGTFANTYARVLVHFGDAAGALPAARVAAEADPHDPGRLLRLGIAERAAGNTIEALRTLRLAADVAADGDLADAVATLIAELEAAN